jgi:ribonuclease P protein component
MTRRLRFGKDRRLLRRPEFERVFAEGVRERAGGFTVIVRATDRPRSRLGISVGKRYGNAVRRNHIKRRLREAFRLEQDDLPAGIDIVVIPYPELHGEAFHEVRSRLRRAVGRAVRRLKR